MDNLRPYGWDDQLAAAWQQLDITDCVPARVVADYAANLKIVLPDERRAEISGRLQHTAAPADRPKVGDWVAVRLANADTAVIEQVLSRRSEISRRAAGDRLVKQVMAANVDVAFIVQALDHDFSPQRLQRYLYQLQSSHIQPVVVLNKSDKVADASSYLDQIRKLNIPVVLTSAAKEEGIDQLFAYLRPGRTAVLLGSSGVGKSTITNLLIGEEVQKTQEVRGSDSKGRHTTSHRELFQLDSGGLLIDTPGIRELQLWGTEEELSDSFADIMELSRHCRYTSCSHTVESDCAVQSAITVGTLPFERLANYQKMKAELETSRGY
ncbi:MAG: ribosome small subunit-dependent GTPase A [Candidatus Saccharimonadales bacterium]